MEQRRGDIRVPFFQLTSLIDAIGIASAVGTGIGIVRCGEAQRLPGTSRRAPVTEPSQSEVADINMGRMRGSQFQAALEQTELGLSGEAAVVRWSPE